MNSRTGVLTAGAMLAFAGNSLLCRLALEREAIDAASFTSIRIVSGAVVLALLTLRHNHRNDRAVRDPRAALMLFAYMACFSFAYVYLDTGTGALILFGAVQVTMILGALRGGERLSAWSWFGLAAAVGGLVWLVSPGVTAPTPFGALLMAVAGIAWGIYSLRGRGTAEPIVNTGWNFLLCAPFAIVLLIAFRSSLDWQASGVLLAVASGTGTSGLGYVIWYATVRRLTAASAATVQLTVPVIAAIGGVVWLSEQITARLVLASLATLGGVWIVLAQRTSRAQK
jgi:drug/metabolite transporter (DMT)-like permease